MFSVVAMKDMAKTPAEVAEAMDPKPVMASVDKYPYGLCIRLDEDSIQKLEIDNMPESGDMIHLMGFAKVTSVSMRDTEEGTCRCIELQITHLALEDEMDEGADDEAAEGEY